MKTLHFCLLLFLAAGPTRGAAPVNDDFAQAAELPSKYVYGPDSGLDFYSSYRFLQTLSTATSEPGEPEDDGMPAEHSAWFIWTSPVDAGCNFDVGFGGKGRPHAAVFTGDRLDALRLESSSVVASPGNIAIASFHAHQGVTYHLRMDVTGVTNAQSFGGQGAFFIASTNDDFAHRQLVTLTNGSGGANFRTAGATREANEPTVNQTASVWFEFVTPETGAYEVEAGGYLITAALFRGERLEGLSLVGDSGPVDRHYSEIRFVGQAGDRFVLAVSDPHGFNYAQYAWGIHRAPRYDPVPGPRVRLALIPVTWPYSAGPTNRLGLLFEAVPGRLYNVETSADLQHWRQWSVQVPKGTNVVVDLENGPPIDNFVRVVAPD